MVRALRQARGAGRPVTVEIEPALLREILEQIDGVIYEDPATGVLKLIAVNPVDDIHDVLTRKEPKR